ncbi:MAG: hypothetical protein KDC38_11735, partial [Planctomycetes bacterium]|nr:hypothetical protein [Planctomycetota bacterium]
MVHRRLIPILLGVLSATLHGPSFGQCTLLDGVTPSDGALTWTAGSLPIDLNDACVGSWDTPSAVPGQGVYDPELWVVVYKYDSVDIPSGTPPVTFLPHYSGAPVVWLVDGDVTIAGEVRLDAL